MYYISRILQSNGKNRYRTTNVVPFPYLMRSFSRLELFLATNAFCSRTSSLQFHMYRRVCRLLVQRTFRMTQRGRFVFSLQGIMLCCLSFQFLFVSVVVTCSMPQNCKTGSALSFKFCYLFNKVSSALKSPKFGRRYR
uniref:EF-hand domain-containing protein n=1 Tax=Parascaris univalens TaxID=6257 RepID=A0A915B382_PARUN